MELLRSDGVSNGNVELWRSGVNDGNRNVEL